MLKSLSDNYYYELLIIENTKKNPTKLHYNLKSQMMKKKWYQILKLKLLYWKHSNIDEILGLFEWKLNFENVQNYMTLYLPIWL